MEKDRPETEVAYAFEQDETSSQTITNIRLREYRKGLKFRLSQLSILDYRVEVDAKIYRL